MEFIGLLVINDIDNWFGMAFEYYLDTFYEEEEYVNHETYLVF